MAYVSLNAAFVLARSQDVLEVGTFLLFDDAQREIYSASTRPIKYHQMQQPNRGKGLRQKLGLGVTGAGFIGLGWFGHLFPAGTIWHSGF